MVHHFMGFRLLLLAAMGLAALYMLHLLAMDYNKIRRPIATIRSFLRLKRGVPDGDNRVASPLKDDFNIDWQKILKYDPMRCLQSLTCQLFAGAETGNEDGKNIKMLLRYSLKRNPPKQIVSAIKKGLQFEGNPKKCAREYYYCFYSASIMLRIIRFFSNMFG